MKIDFYSGLLFRAKELFSDQSDIKISKVDTDKRYQQSGGKSGGITGGCHI